MTQTVVTAVIQRLGSVASPPGGSTSWCRDIGPSEAESFWTDFLRKLKRRGLKGVKLVISDGHEGIRAAVSKVFCAT
jgi:hypothetical protein